MILIVSNIFVSGTFVASTDLLGDGVEILIGSLGGNAVYELIFCGLKLHCERLRREYRRIRMKTTKCTRLLNLRLS